MGAVNPRHGPDYHSTQHAYKNSQEIQRFHDSHEPDHELIHYKSSIISEYRTATAPEVSD